MRVMIIRTKVTGDEATKYTNAWLEDTVRNADNMGWDVIDLTGQAANRQMTEAWITEFQPQLIIGAGHGYYNEFIGSDEKPIFTENNTELLRGRTIFLLSCTVGQDLGQKIGQVGCFIGWNRKVEWTLSPNRDPETDQKAAPLRDTINTITTSLLSQDNIEETYHKAQQRFDEWLETLKNENADPETIHYLEQNKQNLVYYCGNKKTTLQQSNIILPIALLTLTGILAWWLLTKKKKKG